MASSLTQFASLRRMGIYDPFHQINMWEDAFKADIGTNTRLPVLVPVDTGLDDKSEYTSSESMEPSGNNQATRSTLDKIQRRLAQNRKAARKSRLRKKAYVQQLETSRLKLAQLEQEIERARQLGLYAGGSLGTVISGFPAAINSGIAAFEMEYRYWVEEQEKKNCDLRNMLQTQTSEIELRLLVDSVLDHYRNLFCIKAGAAKADVFYLIFGMWRTSVERFFLWIGGFRPSELLNTVMPQLEPLSEQQRAAVQILQLSCQQAEDALSQGMDKLQQILAQCIASDSTSVGSYIAQMVSAIENLKALEGFVNQADHLRQQTLQQMSRILTTHQTAQGLLALGDYFERFRALSSVWAARPHDPPAQLNVLHTTL